MLKILKKIVKIKYLSSKLIINYTFLIMAAIIFIGSVAYDKAAASIEKEVKRNFARNTLQLSMSIDRLVEDFNRMTTMINSDEAVLNILRKDRPQDPLARIDDYYTVQQSILSISALMPNIVGFTIFQEDGRSFNMGLKSVNLNYNFKEDIWYQELKKGNTYFIGVHYQQNVAETYARDVVSFAKIIKDKDTFEDLAYLLIDYDMRMLDDFLKNQNIYPESSMHIIGRQNELIFSLGTQLCSCEDIKDLLDSLEISDRVKYHVTKIDGKELIFSYYTSSVTGIKVLNIVPLKEIYRGIHAIRSYTFIVVIVSIFITAILSYMIAQNITSPLKNLSEKMEIIKQGNFDVRVSIDSEDEVGLLAQNFNEMISKINVMIKKVYTSELAKKEAEINALQAQINPHFLHNTLAAIDSMAVIKGEKEISEMCRALSRLFRYSIETGEISTVGREIEKIKVYLYIEKKRFGDRLEYYISTDEGLRDCSIVKFLLQPVIENAVVHGLQRKGGKVDIFMNIRRNGEDKITIEVTDTGAGMDRVRLAEIKNELNKTSEIYWKDENKGQFHIGLKNVNHRIKLNYGEEFGVCLLSEEGKGTTVILTIPEIRQVN